MLIANLTREKLTTLIYINKIESYNKDWCIVNNILPVT